MHIFIAGGTGAAGHTLARHATAAGHSVTVLSRTPPDRQHPGICYQTGNLLDGSGLDEALRGVDVVVDASNTTAADKKTATRFFTRGTEQLLAAEHRAGVTHHVCVSIVGVDALPSGYYQAKVAQEQAVQTVAGRTGIGHTIARITQFHDFATAVLARFRLGPVVLAPPLKVRPVHLDDVAQHLLTLLADGPVGVAAELSGPRDEDLLDMTRRLAAVSRRRLLILPAPLLGATRSANNAHALRPTGGVHGTITFDTWLEQQQ